jgi:signal transduction histidine kinase
LMRVEEKMCLFLEENSERLLQLWMEEVVASKVDRRLIYENGQAMIQLVILFLRGQIDLLRIRELAQKVALERMNANVNIEEFVFNVSLGRSVIFHHLHEIFVTLKELQPVINNMNQCFDHFLYHAVQKYTELKNTDLEDKKLFIEHTHKDRLTILGQMSASFVHEFRNPLTSVIGFVKLLQQSNPRLEYLNIIQHELDQLNYRISQFLLISKKGATDKVKETFPLSVLLNEILEFLYPSIACGEVEVDLKIEADLFLYGYRDELKQVFINLILNSIDAIQQNHDSKKLMLEALSNKTGTRISISNNGPAISANLISAIFEPFVTTKDLGTGLGLFVCKQIMDQHGGTIECESNDQCTTFTMHLRNG